jgi:hypothetical protein
MKHKVTITFYEQKDSQNIIFVDTTKKCLPPAPEMSCPVHIGDQFLIQEKMIVSSNPRQDARSEACLHCNTGPNPKVVSYNATGRIVSAF